MLSRVPVKKLSTQRTSCPSVEQALAEVRAEEAGAAGDQNAFAGHHVMGLLIRIQYAPSPRNTAGAVFRRMCRSNQNDWFSM